MNSGTAGTIFSAALHAAAIGAALLLSARGGNEVVSAADPLLAILADADADPTKDAGLVGEARGPAEGVPDRNASPEASLPENDFSFSEMEALTRASEKALETPLPDPEPPAPVPAEARPAAPVPAKPVPAKASEEKKTRAPEKKPAAASPGKKSGSDMALVSLAVVLALAGVCGFSFLSDQTLLVRLGVLIGGLVLAVLVAWFSPSGKRFIVYGRESYDELRRVVWPTRKETLNSTGMVIAFVVVVAVFLFLVDMIVEWGLYDVLLKLSL